MRKLFSKHRYLLGSLDDDCIEIIRSALIQVSVPNSRPLNRFFPALVFCTCKCKQQKNKVAGFRNLGYGVLEKYPSKGSVTRYAFTPEGPE